MIPVFALKLLRLVLPSLLLVVIGCTANTFSTKQVDLLTLTPVRGHAQKLELKISEGKTALPISLELTALPQSPATFLVSFLPAPPPDEAFNYVTMLQECNHQEKLLSDGAVRRLFAGIQITKSTFSTLPLSKDSPELKVSEIQGSLDGSALTLCSFSMLKDGCITDVVAWKEGLESITCKEGLPHRLALTLFPLAKPTDAT